MKFFFVVVVWTLLLLLLLLLFVSLLRARQVLLHYSRTVNFVVYFINQKPNERNKHRHKRKRNVQSCWDFCEIFCLYNRNLYTHIVNSFLADMRESQTVSYIHFYFRSKNTTSNETNETKRQQPTFIFIRPKKKPSKIRVPYKFVTK